MPDYIPQEEDQFDHWATTFGAWIAANGTTHGLVAGQLTAFNAVLTAWGYSWAAFTNARTALHAANEDKDTKRAALEAEARDLAAIVQKNPATTNEDRANAGLTVPKDSRTPAPIASSHPVPLKIDTSSRGILRLFFVDSATPEKKAKPEGQAFCEIREQIGGTAPTDPATMSFLASESRTPYRADYEAGEVGQTAWFAMRWVNTRGKAGPWSPVFSAVVPS